MSGSPPATDDHDVIVVGCGPVGAYLASLLVAHRVPRVLVIERDGAIYAAPRAVAIDDGAIRAVGVADATLSAWLAAHVLRAPVDVRSGPPARGGRSRAARSTCSCVCSIVGPVPPRAVESSGGYPDTSFFYQPAFEARLRNAAFSGTLGGSTLLRGSVTNVAASPCASCRDTGASPGCAACRVTVDVTPAGAAEGAGGTGSPSSTRLRARYVVGADGGSSVVRRALNIAFEGTSFPDSPWIVIDVETTDSGVCERWTNFNFVCDAGGRPFVHVPLPGPRGPRRFEFVLHPGEDAGIMVSDASVTQLLESVGVPRSAVRVVRAVVYTFHARVAALWCADRVVLAGDAAHCMPPFRGAGLCAGLRDAAALAWRLATVARADVAAAETECGSLSVAHREALKSVLCSYETERRAHVAAVTALAVRMGALIALRSRVLAAVRDVCMGTVNACAAARPFMKDPFSTPDAYDEGLLGFSARGNDARVGRAIPNALLRTPQGGCADSSELMRLDQVISVLQRTSGWVEAPLEFSKAEGAIPWTLVLAPKVAANAAIAGVVQGAIARARAATGNSARVVYTLAILPASGAATRASRHAAWLADPSPPPAGGEEAWWRAADSAAGDETNVLSAWFADTDVAALVRPDSVVHSILQDADLRGDSLAEALWWTGGPRAEPRPVTLTQSRRPHSFSHPTIAAAASLVAVVAIVAALHFRFQ